MMGVRLLSRSSRCDLLLGLAAERKADEKDRLVLRNVVTCSGCVLLRLDGLATAKLTTDEEFWAHVEAHRARGDKVPIADLEKERARIAAALAAPPYHPGWGS